MTVVFPSDHIINDDLNFLNIIQKSRTIAQEYLVTYGVKPCQPHTGYGYIIPLNELFAVFGKLDRTNIKRYTKKDFTP